MQLPQININGTAREDLLRDHFEALRALRHAAEKLSAIWPHGRDYQTAEKWAFAQAQREHADRLRKVREVMAEIETIAEHLA